MNAAPSRPHGAVPKSDQIGGGEHSSIVYASIDIEPRNAAASAARAGRIMISLIAVIVPGSRAWGGSYEDDCHDGRIGLIWIGLSREGRMSSRYFATAFDHTPGAIAGCYQACGTLSETEYMRERGSFFGSLHGSSQPYSGAIGSG